MAFGIVLACDFLSRWRMGYAVVGVS